MFAMGSAPAIPSATALATTNDGLLPPEIAAQIPRAFTSVDADPLVHVHLFAVATSASWYVIKLSPIRPAPAPLIAYCFCAGLGADEFAHVPVAELETLLFCGVRRVVRDRYFTPRRLSEIKNSRRKVRLRLLQGTTQ